MISDDLVNSYHLLLCALDLVFTNALLCNARKDLLNPEFKGGVLRLTYTSFLPLLTDVLFRTRFSLVAIVTSPIL